MNSYNENLHSSIVSSLSDQELEMQKAKAQMDASKFSLYYAQGAVITASEMLDKTTEEYYHQQVTHKEAVIDSDFSTNVLSSANAGKAFIDESVSNTSVAAANVQIATNAITKLASDIGAVFNIVNAADYGGEIYDQTDYANKVMSETAFLAERVSQISMKTSSSIAEVPTTALASKASTTDASIKKLLEVVTANFTATGEELAANNEALANANTTEKAAEGVLEQNNVNYCAISDAYYMSNKELNLDLGVMITKPVENTKEFMVSFDRYVPAFPKPENSNTTDSISPLGYPVESYYIMFTKYDRSSIFSIANAEGIIQGDPTNKKGKYRYIEVSPVGVIPILPPVGIPPIQPIIFQEDTFQVPLNLEDLVDTDGVPLTLGESYVAFVMATFTNDYKKLINTYDDYLSAPSKFFKLTTYLEAVDSKNIVVLGNTENDSEIELAELLHVDFEGKFLGIDISGSVEVDDDEKIAIKDGKLVFQNELVAKASVTLNDTLTFETEETIADIGAEQEVSIEDSYEQVIVFAMSTDADGDASKEYRCMLLPNDPEKIKNLLTEDDLKEIQNITENKDRIVFEWARKINEILEQIKACEGEVQEATDKLATIRAKIKALNTDPSTVMLNKETKATEVLDLLLEKLKELFESLAELKNGEKEALLKLEEGSEVPEFYFDLTIAQKVPYGSYTPVLNKITFLDAVDFWYFQLEPSTTDNFGNRLNLGEDYIPVILTIANDDSYTVNKQFTNALSNITKEGVFKYALPKS